MKRVTGVIITTLLMVSGLMSGKAMLHEPTTPGTKSKTIPKRVLMDRIPVSQNIEITFNVSKIIEQVRHHPTIEGNKIISKDRFNEAYFDGQDIVLTAMESKGKEGEFLIDTGIVYVPAGYSQRFPSIAFDGTNFLVVWADSRSGSYDIYGTRVNPSGSVLDPEGIAISTAAYDQYYPSIAFDGTNYLVVWEDRRNGYYSDIYGARVNPSGTVLDTAGIAISTATYRQLFPSIAYDGTNYLVVWRDERNSHNSDIYGARVNPSGSVLDPEGIAISTALDVQWQPSIAFDGTNYLVVWGDTRSGRDWDIYGARVSQSGSVLDTAGIAISTAAYSQYYPSIAFDGINYLVVWEDTRTSYNSNIYGARVDPSGCVLNPSGIAISTAADKQLSPSIAFDGTNYLVVWKDKRNGYDYDIYGARVNRSGSVLDLEGIAISTMADDQKDPSIAFDGINYLVVWEDGRSCSDCDIYGTRVSPSGSVHDSSGIAISTAAYSQYYPSIAFDGTNYLVVWEDRRNGYNSDIYGARVSPSGSVLDPEGITISTAAGDHSSPSIAFDGTNFLVVWRDERNSHNYYIYGARVSPSGSVLDSLGFVISTSADNKGYPSIAFDGINYLVVWREGQWPGDIYGTRVSPSGSVLDPEGIAISTAVDDQSSPSIAFGETNYFVVWEDSRSYPCHHIYGARVNPSGSVLDPAGIAISTAAGEKSSPSLAFDGTNYLVAWEDWRSWSDWDIYSARVDSSGFVLDPSGIAISTAADDQSSPSLAFDGKNYLVVWTDYRSGYYDIYGAMVSPEGTIVDEFPVSTQPGNQVIPALAHGQGDQLFIVYSGFADSINGIPANTMRIWGKFCPFTGIEDDSSITSDVGVLLCVSPNPFVDATLIKLHIPSNETPGSLRVYDICGRVVKEFCDIVSGCKGVVEIRWVGDDNSGRELPPGVYFIYLKTDKYTNTSKAIKIK